MCNSVWNQERSCLCLSDARCLEIMSEIIGDAGPFELESFVHGHHVYHTSWTPRIDEILEVACKQL